MTAKTRIARKRRHARVRMKISGTSDRPRLNVYRSSKHIYAQVIDDTQGMTLVSASTIDKELLSQVNGKSKAEQLPLSALWLPSEQRQLVSIMLCSIGVDFNTTAGSKT